MMFKILPILTIALAVIFLLIAALAFRRKWKNILKTALLITGIFGVAFFYILHVNKLNNQFVPMNSTSMFKKLEYVEKLNLVSFYSEEVLVLGTKEKVQKRVDKLTQDSIALALREKNADEELSSTLKQLDKVASSRNDNQTNLVESSMKLDSLHKIYKNLQEAKLKSQTVWEDTNDMLDDKTTYIVFKECWEQHDSLVKNFNSKPWKSNANKRNDYKKDIKDLRERFLDAKRILLNRLELKIELEESRFNNIERESKKKDRLFNRQQKDVITKIDQARKAWGKAVEKLQKISYKLQEARGELALAREIDQDIEPEILIVVPAEVSSYIDMSAIKIRKDDLDTVHILLPPVLLDSVVIDLKEDAIYNLDKDKREWIATQQGAYFDIFGQLKDALLEKEQMIKDKASENGILVQGYEMAKSYLRNFIQPLGYEVVFENEKLDIGE